MGLPLVVAGPEKEPDVAQRLRDGGADVRGYLSKQELAELYRGAAALLLPSRYEGFGLPVLEAMASGTPVVLSADAAMREVAGDAAVYVEDGDAAGAFGARSPTATGSPPPASRARRSSAGRESARLTAEAYRRVLA